MKQLITGGIRSGKSALAEHQALASESPVLYVATATAGDGEMAERIRRHQARRPADWQLVEEPLDLAEVLRTSADRSPCVLIDCMSLWVSNLMHREPDGMAERVDDFLSALETYPGEVVVVSNEVGLGLVPMDAMSREFCDQLGWLNQSLAQRCDRVMMAVSGLSLVLKGEPLNRD